MGNRPEVQSHLVSHKSVSVIKQVDVTPGQRTVLLNREKGKGKSETEAETPCDCQCH